MSVIKITPNLGVGVNYYNFQMIKVTLVDSIK